jgi:hypothetical protein
MARVLPSNEIVFSKVSQSDELHIMIQQSLEESYKKISDENH